MRQSATPSCIAEGGYAGGGHVMYPENPNDFQCCAGLTKAERSDGTTFADAGYTCIKQGDNICDAEYESELNSSDCRHSFDPKICTTYYDGCNTCTNMENGAACTKMACLVQGKPYCTGYVDYAAVNQVTDSDFL